jgi:serine phosphatase RsbU (regulator of sigma subunit)
MAFASRPYDEGSSLPAVGGSAAIPDAISVLLVEDDDGDALLVEDLLAEAMPGGRISRSRTFADALEELDSGIDCILLDLRLPDAEGLDTVVRVRARTTDIPLIVLTGLNDEAAGAAAVAAGAQDYLLKGQVDGAQLARAIRYAIGRRQAEHAQQQLRLADVQAREVTRLERGLAPRPLISGNSVWIASRYHAGRSRGLLGGDFFDVTEAPDGRLRAVVGDVCGHGPDEAAIGVCLRAAWRALAVAGVDSDSAMHVLERVLEHERNIDYLFTTLCTLEIDPSQATGQMILAGHPPPMLIDGATVTPLSLTPSGPPIGLTSGSWTQTPLELPAGWALLLYTDGLTEARVGGGSERLGIDGLRELLADHLNAHADWRHAPEDLLAELIARAEALNGGELTDDVAMLLIGSHADPSSAP